MRFAGALSHRVSCAHAWSIAPSDTLLGAHLEKFADSSQAAEQTLERMELFKLYEALVDKKMGVRDSQWLYNPPYTAVRTTVPMSRQPSGCLPACLV